MSSVLAFCLAGQGGVGRNYLGLLGGASRIATALGSETHAALLGSDIDAQGAGQELLAYGADRVFCVNNPLLQEVDSDVYVRVAEQVCRKLQPRLVLFLCDDDGRALAPRLAWRLGTGLTTDCTAFDVEDGVIVALKPVFGGKALARVVCKSQPGIATVRVRSMEALARDEARSGEITVLDDIAVDASWKKVEVLDRVKEEVKGIRLEDAEVVVSGGRGIGGAEEFAALHDLARKLGAGVGASRAAVDEGWVPAGMQVGLTGKMIGPSVYIAVGISGASQHIAGVSNAKNIIAINSDPDAPIFRYARLGVAEDYRTILPALGKALEELMKD
ncbi:MAG: electron transfer flavoprotein subunit alpha/FixB family protein [Chloroflexi bacterium]|nr:electron transfer flavoprotein subunit alpha/FixB family protein [Chloroflexota bacterium]